MQVEAIYDHGKLEFVKPLKLKHDRFRLVVTVPDDVVDDAFDHTVSEEVLMLSPIAQVLPLLAYTTPRS